MKKLFALLCLFTSYSALAEELETPSYNVTIVSNCAEGEVSCDNVSYTGISKKTGKSISLKGSTWHSLCADGVTPCRFLGYKFKNGEVTYTVSEDGNLEVVKGNKVLFSEQGNWH
jgi:hypothetical protein